MFKEQIDKGLLTQNVFENQKVRYGPADMTNTTFDHPSRALAQPVHLQLHSIRSLIPLHPNVGDIQTCS